MREEALFEESEFSFFVSMKNGPGKNNSVIGNVLKQKLEPNLNHILLKYDRCAISWGLCDVLC